MEIASLQLVNRHEPANFKWVEPREQCRNKRDTKYAEINGVTKPLIEWAELYEIQYKTMTTIWYRGWRGINLIKPSKVS